MGNLVWGWNETCTYSLVGGERWLFGSSMRILSVHGDATECRLVHGCFSRCLILDFLSSGQLKWC